MGIVLIISLLGSTAWTYDYVDQLLEQANKRNATAIAKGAGIAISDSLLTRDYAEMEVILRQVLSNENIYQATILDLAGNVLVNMQRHSDSGVPTLLFTEKRMNPPQNLKNESLFKVNHTGVSVWYPVHSGIPAGWIRLEIVNTTTGLILGNLYLNVITLSVALLILIIIITGLIFYKKINTLMFNGQALLKRHDNSLIQLHREVGARRRSEKQLIHLAFFDKLTDLPNRLLLIDRIQKIQQTYDFSVSCACILLIDLNNFRKINHTVGYEFGNMVIKQISQRLLEAMPADGTVFRIGGNEFAILLSALSTNVADTDTAVTEACNRISLCLSPPFLLNNVIRNCEFSMGIAYINDHNSEIERILRSAQIAMYKSKIKRLNMVFFDQAMEDEIMARVTVEEDLKLAIEKKQFELVYQIKVDAAGTPTGAEALIRWNHPVIGLITPGDFILIAEETGYILSIGQWVLEQGCIQLKKWQPNKITEHLILAVNVSAIQFIQPDFVAQVKYCIERYCINPHFLKLELTESFLINDLSQALEVLLSLKALGVQLSLDDFGTGFSSLQYLEKLPFDEIKIDQSFTQSINEDPDKNTVVQAIIALAHVLGMSVIAEGVETEFQRHTLLTMGCMEFQGYLFSKPLPIEDFEKLVVDMRCSETV